MDADNMQDYVGTVCQKGEKDALQASVHIKSIQFKDGSTIEPAPNCIVVFTGPNNCGKSQVLRDIEYLFQKRYDSSIVASSLSADVAGELDWVVISKRFFRDEWGNFWIGGRSNSQDTLLHQWHTRSLECLYALFVSRLDTEQRLLASKTMQHHEKSPHEPKRSLQEVYENNAVEDTISELFFEAFGESLLVNRRGAANISMHVGEQPIWENDRSGEGKYYEAVGALPILDKQGDGMRSFASILLDAFASNHSISLIDEPEAFLHPPQARLIGKLLANYSGDSRQMFIATHSSEFINGLLDSNNENVTVIRIHRDGNHNFMHTLDNQKIRDLWSNPIMRYSNILNGLFHQKVVVCESDYCHSTTKSGKTHGITRGVRDRQGSPETSGGIVGQIFGIWA